MSVTKLDVKKMSRNAGAAPLRNLKVIDDLAIKLINRPLHLPGIGCFAGPSGFGKSTAAAFIAAKYGAYHVEFRSTWTRKAMLESLLKTMGIPAGATVNHMLNQVSEELGNSQRPIILDEFDYAVSKDGLVDLVRDIYEQSMAPVLIIGEEKLPQKLQKSERFHGRIMEWAKAEPADLEDAKVLNRHYAADITVHDDLLSILVTEARGSIRRIVTNLDRIAYFARSEGVRNIGSQEWGSRPLHTSTPPRTREF